METNIEQKDTSKANGKGVDVDGFVKKLLRLQQKYIKMLGEEIDSMASIAHIHGWRSKNIEVGERLRKQIKEVKKKLPNYEL